MPQVKGGPAGLNKILESAYRSCMSKYNDETKCSKIAWGAAKNAGWKKGSDGKWHKEEMMKNKELYTLDAEEDGACEWIKSDEGNFEFADEDGSYSAVAVIGNKFYHGKFLASDELEKSYRGMDGAFHDINHFGTSYPAGLFSRPNIEWIVGYQNGTTFNKRDNRMKTKIHIEDSAPKADVWKSFMKICEKAGRVPNVSVSFWASRKDVLAKDLPEGVDYKSQGYEEESNVPYLYDLDFRALSTVFEGACNDKAGCGVGINQTYTISSDNFSWCKNGEVVIPLASSDMSDEFVDLEEFEKEIMLKEKLKHLKEENYE